MNKTTLGMLVVAGALLAYALLGGSTEENVAKPMTVSGYMDMKLQDEWSKRKENPLLFLAEKEDDRSKKFAAPPYDEIELSRDGESIALKRTAENEWKMSAPVESEVESFRIKNMLESFATDTALTPSRTLKNTDLFADFGLDERRGIHVILKEGGQVKVNLVIGDRKKLEGSGAGGGPEKYDTFVRVADQPNQVFRARLKDLRTPFDIPVGDIRSKKVFTLDLTEITKVTIDNPDNSAFPHIELAARWEEPKKEEAVDGKTDDKKKKKKEKAKAHWTLVSPKIEAFSLTDLRTYWSTIAGLRASKFYMKSNAPPESGLANKNAPRVTLEVKDGKPITVVFGLASGKDKNFYAQVQGRAEYMTVSEYSKKNILKSLADLRDKNILDIQEEAEISRIEVTNEHTGGQSMVFEREGDTWLMRSPSAMQPSQREVKNLVSGLRHFRVTAFETGTPEATESGLDKPAITVKATIRGQERTLLFGNERDSKVYSHLVGSSLYFKIGTWTKNKFDKKPGDFRNKEVVAVDPALVTSIKLDHGTEIVELTRVDSEHWKVTAPEALSADNGLDERAAAGIANTLKSLEIKAFSAKKPAEVGLDKPAFTLTATLSDGSKRVVRVSDQLKENAHYITVDSPGVSSTQVFTLDQYRVKNLRKKLADLKKDG